MEARLAANSATCPILTFLMLHHDLHPGYDYLLERKFASIWREIRTCPLGFEIDRFLVAECLGFSHRVRVATGSQAPVRLLIQTGRRIDELTLADLDEFTTACRRRQERTGKGHQLPRGGQQHPTGAVPSRRRRRSAPPTRTGAAGRAPREVAGPLRAELIAYLERKRATCGTKTVSTMTTRLKIFGVFLNQTDPALVSVRDLDRRRHIEPFLASLVDTVSEKDGQPISIGDRNRRVVAVSTFLTDITEWEGAPPRGLDPSNLYTAALVQDTSAVVPAQSSLGTTCACQRADGWGIPPSRPRR